MGSDTKDLVQTASEVRVTTRHQILEAQKLKDAFRELGMAFPYQQSALAEEHLKEAVKALTEINAENVLG